MNSPGANRKRGRPRLPPDRVLRFRTISARLESGLVDAFEAWCRDRKTTPHREIADFVKSTIMKGAVHMA